MAQKLINFPDIGDVVFHKRKGARSLRITVSHDGTIRVSMPHWTPYQAGEAFVHSKSAWVRDQLVGKGHHVLQSEERIGKAHRIKFVREQRITVTCRVTKTELIVKLPQDQDSNDASVQAEIRKAAVRALKQEAKILLPQRLQALASNFGFEYRSVSIKRLKSRWGSCSSHKDIALNCFLMQLPWELIDYVLLHELLHTRIMAHGPLFWAELDKFVPNLATKRRAIKIHKPALNAVE